MRKKTAAIAALLIVAAFAAFAAQIEESGFSIMSPTTLATGGSFTADAHGYNSFFYNPAGLSRDGGDFTALSATAWIYSRPDALLAAVQNLMGGTFDSSAIMSYMSDQVTAGGFGVGGSLGIGYATNGLGLGLVITADSMLYGPTLMGLTGDLTGTVAFLCGLSVPFDLGGGTLHVGGDIRPMIRIHAPLENAEALALMNALASSGDIVAALSSANAVYGTGIGLDAGAIAEFAGFTVGLSMRDIFGTHFKFSTDTFDSVLTSLGSSLSLPSGTAVADDYFIPMSINLGIGWHPDLGGFSKVLDPTISADLKDLWGLIFEGGSLWTRLHVGAEIRLVSVFSVRAGINQGYLTAGVGLNLFVIDLNVSLFTQELGTYLGDRPCSGASVEFAVRF